jgi:NIMA (never in mitosis gene a)-related kinase
MSIGEFRLLGMLGEGSYSRVYKAVRLADSLIYAVKRVDLSKLTDSDKFNALNEVRILASLASQYVIKYREAFLEDSALYIVMEMAWGGDLKTRLQEMGAQRFSEEEIWAFTEQIVKGLKALHDKSIIHCDLKSANIFLTGDGLCKLGDLNVSKVAKTGKIYSQTGTPYYAAPEVWRDQPYDEKSDIWSLGVVLYELATGRLPFETNSAP